MSSLIDIAFNVEWLLYLGAIGLIVIGLAGLLLLHNIFRMLLALVILESGANLLLVLSGFKLVGVAPIFILGSSATAVMNDPVPQALVLTAIVIGVGVQALALALIIRIQQRYDSLDMRVIRSGLEQDIAEQAGVNIPASKDKPLAYKTVGVSAHE